MSIYFELLKLIANSKHPTELLSYLLKKAAEMQDNDRT